MGKHLWIYKIEALRILFENHLPETVQWLFSYYVSHTIHMPFLNQGIIELDSAMQYEG
jgi:hypothetical protein